MHWMGDQPLCGHQVPKPERYISRCWGVCCGIGVESLWEIFRGKCICRDGSFSFLHQGIDINLHHSHQTHTYTDHRHTLPTPFRPRQRRTIQLCCRSNHGVELLLPKRVQHSAPVDQHEYRADRGSRNQFSARSSCPKQEEGCGDV